MPGLDHSRLPTDHPPLPPSDHNIINQQHFQQDPAPQPTQIPNLQHGQGSPQGYRRKRGALTQFLATQEQQPDTTALQEAGCAPSLSGYIAFCQETTSEEEKPRAGRALLRRLGYRTPASSLDEGGQKPAPPVIAARVRVMPIPKNMHPQVNAGRRLARVRYLRRRYHGDPDVLYTDAAFYSSPSGGKCIEVCDSDGRNCGVSEMDLLKPPDPLRMTGDISKNWKLFKQKVELYLTVVKPHDKPLSSAAKTALLLRCNPT
ncbi:hypothetical protein HPB47_000616, partial [Ixodes persulcatus]